MSTVEDGGRYGAVSRLLHWGVAALVILAIAVIELTDLFPKGSAPRDGMKYLHIQLGVLLFGLTWLRLAWRSVHAAPPIVPAPRPWEALAAKLMHWALYAAMLALPLLGVAMAQAAGKPIAFLGLPFPVLVSPDKELAHTLKEAHELLGNAVIALIAIHAAAAVWHRAVRKDNTLTRMLPERFA